MSTASTLTNNYRWIETGRRLTRPRWVRALLVLTLTAVLAVSALAIRNAAQAGTSGHRQFPQSAALEQQLGVRFSRLAVVGDGGLLTLSYVVLDPDKATVFQADTQHPPKLSSESRTASTTRVSLMKQGHSLRAGATYYLVYENTRNALRPGERATLTDGQLVLAHLPVL